MRRGGSASASKLVVGRPALQGQGAYMTDASGGAAVSVINLRKAFGATVAVDVVSFTIGKGSVHALLGENGAGKSTIVKLLSGLILPEAGSIEIFGHPARLRSPRVA